MAQLDPMNPVNYDTDSSTAVTPIDTGLQFTFIKYDVDSDQKPIQTQVQGDINNPENCKDYIRSFNSFSVNKINAITVLKFLKALYDNRNGNNPKITETNGKYQSITEYGLTVYWMTNVSGKKECNFILKDGNLRPFLEKLSKEELASYSDVIKAIKQERSLCKRPDGFSISNLWKKGGKSHKYKKGKINKKLKEEQEVRRLDLKSK